MIRSGRVRWRTAKAAAALKERTTSIRVVQLQGHLFFGNATSLADEVERLLLVGSPGQVRFGEGC